MHDGTCEDEKTGGDAKDATREGGDEAAGAQTAAEGVKGFDPLKRG